MKRLLLLLACAGLVWGGASAGQERAAPAADAEPNEVEGVLVTARRIGVPVWRVSDGRSTLVLIGQIQGVPKDAAWRPAELERTVAQADSVLFPHELKASPADVARVIWRARSVVLLPKGKTLADYVDAATLARLRPWRSGKAIEPLLHPWMVADELITETQAGELFGDDRVTEVVARAARRHRKKRQAVGVQHASRMLDAYFGDPARHVPCLQAALAVAEAGPEAARGRVAAWTRSRVVEVVRSPAERAFDVCWPYGSGRDVLRADWRAALDRRLSTPGVTVAVAPLLYLAEEGGVLDAFAARGLQIDGPRWRPNED